MYLASLSLNSTLLNLTRGTLWHSKAPRLGQRVGHMAKGLGRSPKPGFLFEVGAPPPGGSGCSFDPFPRACVGKKMSGRGHFWPAEGAGKPGEGPLLNDFLPTWAGRGVSAHLGTPARGRSDSGCAGPSVHPPPPRSVARAPRAPSGAPHRNRPSWHPTGERSVVSSLQTPSLRLPLFGA